MIIKNEHSIKKQVPNANDPSEVSELRTLLKQKDEQIDQLHEKLKSKDSKIQDITKNALKDIVQLREQIYRCHNLNDDYREINYFDSDVIMADEIKELLNKKIALYTVQFEKKLTSLTQNLMLAIQENQILLTKIDQIQAN